MAEKRAEYLQCSLCGFEFEKLDSVCASGCPLGAHCGNVRCPNCNFEFPAPSRAARWMRGWFRRRPVVPTGVASVGLDRIPAGSLCLLDHLGCASGGRRNTLTVFGLTPGNRSNDTSRSCQLGLAGLLGKGVQPLKVQNFQVLQPQRLKVSG